MGCKYSKIDNEGRYNCKITDSECIYLIPNKSKCIKDGYLDEDAPDYSSHQLIYFGKKED